MTRCNRRAFGLGMVGVGVAAVRLLTRSAFAADSLPAVPGPLPNSIAIAFDRPIRIGASSEAIRLPGDDQLHVLSVGTGTFHLTKDGLLTAKLNAAVAQYAKVEYRIYAAVFDARGLLLGTAAHVEPVERVRLGAMPTMFRQVDLDFGQSRDFGQAAYVSVAVSNPEFPEPEN